MQLSHSYNVTNRYTTNNMTASATIQGRVVKSPIKLIQDKREF